MRDSIERFRTRGAACQHRNTKGRIPLSVRLPWWRDRGLYYCHPRTRALCYAGEIPLPCLTAPTYLQYHHELDPIPLLFRYSHATRPNFNNAYDVCRLDRAQNVHQFPVAQSQYKYNPEAEQGYAGSIPSSIRLDPIECASRLLISERLQRGTVLGAIGATERFATWRSTCFWGSGPRRSTVVASEVRRALGGLRSEGRLSRFLRVVRGRGSLRAFDLVFRYAMGHRYSGSTTGVWLCRSCGLRRLLNCYLKLLELAFEPQDVTVHLRGAVERADVVSAAPDIAEEMTTRILFACFLTREIASEIELEGSSLWTLVLIAGGRPCSKLPIIITSQDHY